MRSRHAAAAEQPVPQHRHCRWRSRDTDESSGGGLPGHVPGADGNGREGYPGQEHAGENVRRARWAEPASTAPSKEEDASASSAKEESASTTAKEESASSTAKEEASSTASSEEAASTAADIATPDEAGMRLEASKRIWTAVIDARKVQCLLILVLA